MVQLQRDPQVKITAQRIVLGDERRGRRAAGNRLHHRRFHFHITAVVEKAPDFADNRAALQEHVLHAGIGNQIEVTLTVADFRVFQPVPFAGRRAQCLGQNGEAGELDGDFAGLGDEQRALGADEIAQVEVGKNVKLFVAEDVLLGVYLDAAALVAHVNEHGLAHVPVRGDTPGHGYFAAFHVVAPRRGAGFRGGEFVAKGKYALGLQPCELGLALFDQ